MKGGAFWAMIAAIGVGTFLLRLSFVHWMGKRTIPPAWTAALRLVPAAVLTSLVLGAVLFPAGAHDPGGTGTANLRPAAAFVAALAAVSTRNILLTIVAGMGALWMLRGWF